ncbi:hypothetical protein F5Y16DRAFT_246720 [Xylariaceae sp. FL0255]|nr:hypothetical protein F5Y16DRAFT_246720 [Xylariaceae sp. FL0255]
MDPLSALGGAAAAAQFGGYGITSLVQLISIIQALHDTPKQIRELLQDVTKSLGRLSQLKVSLQDPNAPLRQSLTNRQVERLQLAVDDGHVAIDELNTILKPLVQRQNGALYTGVVKTWKTVVSLVHAKQIEEKLRRIQRLHADVLQQLQITDLELQTQMNSTTLKISSSIQQAQQDIHTMGSQLGLLTSMNSSAYSEIQHTRSDVSTIQAQNTLLLNEQKNIGSGLATLQPSLDRLETEVAALKSQAVLSSLNTLTNRHDQPLPFHNFTMARLTDKDKEDIASSVSAALLASPLALYDALENMSSSPVPARSKVKRRQNGAKYSFTIRFFPILSKTLRFSFEMTAGAGGYSISHSLHMSVTVKRADSPIFQALDHCLNAMSTRVSHSSGPRSHRMRDLHQHSPVLLGALHQILMREWAGLAVKDEDGKTPFQEIVQILTLMEVSGFDLTDYLPLFWSLFERTHLDLSEKTNFHDFRILENPDSDERWDMSPQEYVLWSFCDTEASFRENSPLLQYMQRLSPEIELGGDPTRGRRKLDQDFQSITIRKQHRYLWAKLLKSHPDLIEQFYDPSGLAHAIINRCSKSLPSCFQLWIAMRTTSSREESHLVHLNFFKKSYHQVEVSISPCELAVGWTEGMHLLIRAGASLSEAIATAIEFDDFDSLNMFLDMDYIYAATSEDILEAFEKGTFSISLTGCKTSMEALKTRRMRLSRLALQNLSDSELRELRCTEDVLLDSKAFDVCKTLLSKGIEIHKALIVTTDEPIYHRHSFIKNFKNVTGLNEFFFENGFREIDAEYLSLTPIQTISTWRPALIDWFVSKGATPRISLLGNSHGSKALNAAYMFAKWMFFHHEDRSLPLSNWRCIDLESTALSILRTWAQEHNLAVKDNCRCFCSLHGCSAVRGFAQRYVRSPRWVTDKTLSQWCEATSCSSQEIKALYEDYCRLQFFERLQMVHTCLHNRDFHETQYLRTQFEIDEIQKEDEIARGQLELLMEAYKTSLDVDLPPSPTLTDYSQHLKKWWEELDIILPEVDEHYQEEDSYWRDRCRWYSREAQVLEALLSAGYIEKKGLKTKTSSGYSSEIDPDTESSEYIIPDFSDVIRRHFAHYLDGATGHHYTRDCVERLKPARMQKTMRDQVCAGSRTKCGLRRVQQPGLIPRSRIRPRTSNKRREE